MGLSTELKIAIIDYLDPENIQNQSSDQDNNRDEAGSGNAPQELKKITDILNVSRVCNVFRALATPILCKNILLQNTEKSGKSVQALVDGPYGNYVRQIHHRAKLGIPDPYDSRDPKNQKPNEKHFPESVRTVLSNLTRVPNLGKLIVEFPYTEEELCDAFYTFEDEEEEEQVALSEEDQAWRALMAHTYDAIGQNGIHAPKALELRGLVPVEVSTWRSQGFRSFLASVESFSLSVVGSDNGAGWKSNTLDGYLGFLRSMHSFFFDYLSEVRHFSFTASDAGPPGLEGWRHTPLNLYKHQMPHLKSLYLNHVFISEQLAEFIGSHDSTLESIHLDNCFSGAGCGLAENGITWAAFFSILNRTDLSALKRIQVTPREPLFSPDYSDFTDEDTTRIKQLMEADPARLFFCYKTLDDKYGMLFDGVETAVERFDNGEDQKSYERLLNFVKRNEA